jgi:cytochrome c oxidase subunit IV
MLNKKLNSYLLSQHAQSDGSGGHEEPHVLPLKLYFSVFGALIFLTLVTVGVSLLGLPPLLSILAALGVATVKASLVAGYFMHLKYEDKFYTFIFGASIFFILLFFGLTIGDMAFRDYVIPEQGTEVYRQYELGGNAAGSYKQPSSQTPLSEPTSK